MWFNWLSTAFMVAQVLGASCMLLGLIRLIQGVTGDEGVRAVRRKLIRLLAVSYTHLTLPTIYSV